MTDSIPDDIKSRATQAYQEGIRSEYGDSLATGEPSAVVATIARAIMAETPPPQPQMMGSPADQIIGQIEELFPNWRSYRDLVDCITCELHELRQRAEGR